MEIILLLEHVTKEEALGMFAWHKDKQMASEKPCHIELSYDASQDIYVLIKITTPHDIPDHFTNEDHLHANPFGT